MTVLHATFGPPPIETGIVIAGFGDDDFFPRLSACRSRLSADIGRCDA